MTPAERVLDELDSSQSGRSAKRLRLWLVSAVILVFYAVSWNLAGIDLQKLGTGLPKLAHWIAQAWRR
jgi:phosphonate transport system permease protein